MVMLGQTEDGLEKRRQVLEVMLNDIHHECGIDPRVFMDQKRQGSGGSG